jgi:RNA polymerase sigma-70 factor (ECF subfamily)
VAQAVQTWRRFGAWARGTEAGASEVGDDTASADDLRLLRAGQQGDRGALELLFWRHEGDLFRVCRSMLATPSDAEDAVQESFLRALRALASGPAHFRGDATVRTWLFRIAMNVCLEWKRRDAVRVLSAAVPLDGETGEAVTERAPSPEDETVARLTVRAALLSLPARSRALLVLREQEQWSCAEIGALLGWGERKVQNELAKARRALARWREEERL